MTSAALLLLAFAALVVHGLERNHARQPQLRRLAGHVDAVDRDVQRVGDELLVAAGRERSARRPERTSRPVLRPAPRCSVHVAR